MKNELLIYMKNDIDVLFEIIDIFNAEMFDLENIDITKVSLISSTALKTYLTNYYDVQHHPIHIPKHDDYLDIKQAYFGGRVEVFKGYAENVYIYDLVSLYTSIMLKDLPYGPLINSSDTNVNNYFGYCYASVNVPKDVIAKIQSNLLEQIRED